MRAEEQFDSFYLKTRRALVHQTFALTGDLAAAQRAVGDAYVHAWHHWRKVKTYEDPRDWVRPRAWAAAQRRHSARLWQRTRDLSTEDRAVLNALHKLPVSERRALIMALVAGVPLEVGARELNVTKETLEQQLRSATAGFAAAYETEPDAIRAPLMSLGEASSKSALPRAAAIRRQGRTRRRTHTFAAVVATTFLAVGTGAFAHEPTTQAPEAGPLVPAPEQTEQAHHGESASDTTLPSADDLLSPGNVGFLDPKADWRVTSTHDNTEGDGLNYVCQQERFADPEGLATLVRELEAKGKQPVEKVVQVVEISETEDDAAATYNTVLTWFAGCAGGDLHLKRVFDVEGVADEAILLELESWSRPRTSYSATIAHIGKVVTTSVVSAVRGAPPAAKPVARTLAAASQSICERAEREDCGGRPKLEFTSPPPSGDAPGILATVDMPPLVGIDLPWVGTSPEPARKNPATTSCDNANFRKEGAVRDRTRTFLLVPEARLPARFGLTETYGTFKSPEAAAKFMRVLRQRFGKCEDRDLATEVLSPRAVAAGRLRGNTWRLHTELSENKEVIFDVGFVRYGASVAQLTFVPANRAELAPGAFRGLIIRAGQRLAELD
jgi:DNA-directed RNA polymerase specialized sigma24 family protein